MSTMVEISPALRAYLAWERENGVLEGVADDSRRLYAVWRAMRNRCNDPGHGTVCEAWAEFADFERWARSSGYADHLTLDRHDQDQPYSQANCWWRNAGEHVRTTRTTVVIDIDGEAMCATDWAARAGLKVGTVLRRYHLGWRGRDLLRPADKGRRLACAKTVRIAG